MIIDLSRRRQKNTKTGVAGYFDVLEPGEICRRALDRQGNERITVKDLESSFKESDRVVFGTREGDLSAYLGGEKHIIDSEGLVAKIEGLRPDQIIVLPSDYRIKEGDVREIVAYSPDSLVNLDSVQVYRELLGERAPKRGGGLSDRIMIEEKISPEKIISVALGRMSRTYHEVVRGKELIEQNFSAYSWFGKGRDRRRRVVSLYRAIQGAELKAFQNMAALKLLTPQIEKELKTRKHHRTGEELTEEQIARREKKLRKYEPYIRKNNLSESLRRLDVSFDDLIEVEETPFQGGRGRYVRVMSRSRPNEPHLAVITRIPFISEAELAMLKEEEKTADSRYAMWRLIGSRMITEDEIYCSGRRNGDSVDDVFFGANAIAAAHTLHSYLGEQMSCLPFVMPLRETMQYIEKLRRQAVIIEKPETRWRKRSLNNTEMENLLWKLVMVEGYEKTFTADRERLKPRQIGYDYMMELIRFTK